MVFSTLPLDKNMSYTCEVKVCEKLGVGNKCMFTYVVCSHWLLDKYPQLLRGGIGLI
jgi:hypothetical protein